MAESILDSDLDSDILQISLDRINRRKSNAYGCIQYLCSVLPEELIRVICSNEEEPPRVGATAVHFHVSRGAKLTRCVSEPCIRAGKHSIGITRSFKAPSILIVALHCIQ